MYDRTGYNDTKMINESDIFHTSYRLEYDWIIRKVIKKSSLGQISTDTVKK